MAAIILVDNQNVWREAQAFAAKDHVVNDNERLSDPEIRIKFSELLEIAKEKTGITSFLRKVVFDKEFKINVEPFEEELCVVDRFSYKLDVVSDMDSYVHKLVQERKLKRGDKIVLVSGKGDASDLVHTLRREGFAVSVLFWSTADKLLKVDGFFLLDDCFDRLTYRQSDTVTIDERDVITIRREKLKSLKRNGFKFPNEFKPTATAQELIGGYGELDIGAAEFEQQVNFIVAGRIMLKRVMGKASFITLQDRTGKIQLYVSRDSVGSSNYDDFKKWDIGDIIGARGPVFKTKTGELSINVKEMVLLNKTIRPLPDKFHGISDLEFKYRRRYVDLIVTEETRNTFRIRSQVIDGIRRFMAGRDFMEVETPMMHVIPGGAAAKPFNTHHNALDMPLFLRIAPELYLKRLVVGGFERVFEINRNFRNEGVSARHNPEFTMIEFYQAYADYRDLTEEMLRTVAMDVFKHKPEAERTLIEYQGEVFDFGKPFERLSMVDSILKYNPDLNREQLWDYDQAAEIVRTKLKMAVKSIWGIGKLHTLIFEETVETQLRQPTFITEYPAEVSPLARRNDDNAFITDRFEFFIGGREIANGFSELNDPIDQAERFMQQVAEKDAGDDEAMHYDADYIRALEYGLPPTAGEGIGIDRLVMLFANAPSIRDVILFPHMRPEA